MFLSNILFIGLTVTTRVVYNWLSFPLGPSHFILSGAISNYPVLFPSSLLDTFWPGGLIFQCRIIWPFHTFHEVLTSRILESCAIPSSIGLHFIRTSHYKLSILGDPAWPGSYLHWVRLAPSPQGCDPWRGIKNLHPYQCRAFWTFKAIN